MTDSSPNPPSCRVLVRSKQRLELFTLSSLDTTTTTTTTTTTNIRHKVTLLESCATTLQALASDGSAIYVHVVGTGIVKFDLSEDGTVVDETTHTPFLQSTTDVQMLDVSTSGRYLLTWERLNTETCPRNLKVWCSTTGKLLAAWPQKSLSRESWPYLQWTSDESYAFLLSGNQVRVYAASDITDPTEPGGEPRFTDKVQIPGCVTLSLLQQPPSTNGSANSTTIGSGCYYNLTTFAPKTKSQPGTASIYEWSAGSKFNRLASKSLFQAESCHTTWSPNLQLPACLLTLQTAVDATGESYYGSSQLLLWNTEDAKDILSVPLPQDGPVQNVAWLPNPDKPPSFIAIAGKMPAMISQHHGVTGNVTFLFGNNFHRNTIASSPHARFVCLAGFGNLAGGMSFWDVNKKKLIPHNGSNQQGTLRAEAVTMHSWSPDSRFFLVATTAPRMNVDNGLRLYKYTGELVANVPWQNTDYQPNRLLGACFVPALHGVYPDRPQSPLPERNNDCIATTGTCTVSAPAGAATTTASKLTTPEPTGRYVPPSARNRVGGGGTSLADRLRREKEGQLQGATKINKNQPIAVGGRVIPGMSTVAGVTAAAAASTVVGKTKSQMKREKMKLKKEQKQEPLQVEESTTLAVAAQTITTTDPSISDVVVDSEKRARKIRKMLKQIDELKQRTEPLNDDQQTKVAAEKDLRSELEALEL